MTVPQTNSSAITENLRRWYECSQLRSGRLQSESSGVDRSQAAMLSEAIDLVKEISQTCGRSATVRPERTLDRRMVTAAKRSLLRLVLNQEEKEWKHDI